MRIPGKLPTMPRRSIWQTAVPLAASLAIFIFHFSVIAKNAVNIPYFDDWAAFSGADHPASMAYYQHAGDGYCPTVAPANTSIAPRLEQAKRLNASLYRAASR
jgi:hypothetical protein